MNNLVKKAEVFVKRNGATILTCVGAAGVVATSIMTAKATPKAMFLLEEAREEKGEELTKMDIIRIAGPAYIPAVLTGVATLACIFGANTMNKRKQASLVSAYALLDSTFKDYKEKVEELYGEDANKHVHAEIAKDNYDETEDKPHGDNRLFFDNQSMRYFEATMADVVRAEYMLNRELSMTSYVCLNQFYDLLKIPPIEGGDELGWSAYDMSAMYWNPWIEFQHEKVVLEDGLECCIIDITTEPIIDYLDH